MAKIHYHPCTSNQLVLFQQRIDEDIAETDPVRIVNAIVDSLTLEAFKKLYKERGSEENYRFMNGNGTESFVKYNCFHKQQKLRYKPDPFHSESLYYNKKRPTIMSARWDST